MFQYHIPFCSFYVHARKETFYIKITREAVKIGEKKQIFVRHKRKVGVLMLNRGAI